LGCAPAGAIVAALAAIAPAPSNARSARFDSSMSRCSLGAEVHFIVFAGALLARSARVALAAREDGAPFVRDRRPHGGLGYDHFVASATIAVVNFRGSVVASPMRAKRLSHGGNLVEELGLLIGRTRRIVWTNAARKLEEFGETVLAWQLLSHLVRDGKCSQTTLAAAVAQHPAGVSRLLDDLEKQGYVLRRRDPQDRRRIYVEASAKGRRRFEEGRPQIVAAVDQALEPLTDTDRRLLRDLLRKVTGSVSDSGRRSHPEVRLG
jgi:DNA-binding MarR family transcriptional regulator